MNFFTFFTHTFVFIALHQCQNLVWAQSEGADEPPPSVQISSPSHPFFATPVPGKISGKFIDLPKMLYFDHVINRGGNDTKVYDENDKVAFLISVQENNKPIKKDFIIRDPKGKELLRVHMKTVQCRSKESFSTSRGVSYLYDWRGGYPDKWHIRTGTMLPGHLNQDYVYHRRAHSNTGSVKLGNSKTDRVAKFLQEPFNSRNIPGGQAWIIRTDDKLPGEILLGLLVTTTRVYRKCHL